MLMLCIMIFIYEPIFFTTAHFLFGSTAFEWFTVAMIAGIVAILHCIWRGWIYPFSRREAVMQHYEDAGSALQMLLLRVLPRLSDDCRSVPLAKHTDADRWVQGGAGGEHTDGSSTKVEGLPCTAYHGRSPSGSTSEALQYLINQDGRTSRYGQPVYVMQVRETDMGGKFRVGLLNHATFDEIQDAAGSLSNVHGSRDIRRTA